LHGDVLMWLMKTLLTSGCTNQRGAGQSYLIIDFVLSKLYTGSTKSIKPLAADLDKSFHPEQSN
ncbi:hypothetical protein SJ271_27375, partial [Citrobacter freundii]|nr:hypothetical protein [Citrobacter freundii]